MLLESLTKAWMIVPPIILLTGLVGNSLVLLTVTSKYSKTSSFTTYLGALAISDTVFLLATVPNAWLFYGLGIDIMLNAVSCKILTFVTAVFKMTSSFLIAALSTDRAIATYYPQKIDTLGSPKAGMIVIGIGFAFLSILNSHEFYGFELLTDGNITYCGYVDNSYGLFYSKYFTWVDAAMFALLPMTVIIITNILTVVRVVKFNLRARHLLGTQFVQMRVKQNRQMVIIAVSVSLAFLILSSPVAIFDIIRPYLFAHYEWHYAQNEKEFLLITVTFFMTYFNFAINFFLYFMNGSRFRCELKHVLRTKCGCSPTMTNSNESRTNDADVHVLKNIEKKPQRTLPMPTTSQTTTPKLLPLPNVSMTMRKTSLPPKTGAPWITESSQIQLENVPVPDDDSQQNSIDSNQRTVGRDPNGHTGSDNLLSTAISNTCND